MNRIAPEQLAKVGKFVSEAPGQAISIGALARQLGVRYPTAKRRLEAYAAAKGLTLLSGTARVGVRGPEATTWYLRAPAATVLIDPRVRAAFMAHVPRVLEEAVPGSALLKKMLVGLPREISKRTSTTSFAALLSGEDVVTTEDGLVYFAGAVGRPDSGETSSPSPRPSPRFAGRGSDAALGLSQEVLLALTSDELLALRLLAQTGSARVSQMCLTIGHSPDRVGGMMRELRRKLHSLGADVFTDENLPDGETMFRYLGPHPDRNFK